MKLRRQTTPLEPPPPSEAAPYFNDEAAVQAQPVVPLTTDGDGQPSQGYVHQQAGGAHAARGSLKGLPLTLLLLSALAGVVIGGVGLFLYQKQRRAEPVITSEQMAAPQTESQPEPAATQEATEVAAEVAEIEEPAPDSEEPTEAENVPASVVTPAPAAEAAKPDDKPKKNDDDDDDAPVGNLKRGKRGEAVAVEPRRPERRDEAQPAPRAASPEPRRVETIIYPRQRRVERREARREERRAERRERRAIDSVRGIFEGRP